MTDNVLEYYTFMFNDYCKKHGVYMNNTIRKTPQQNRLAEIMKKTLLERVRCMLSNDTTCSLVNISPSTTIENKTPQVPCPHFVNTMVYINLRFI